MEEKLILRQVEEFQRSKEDWIEEKARWRMVFDFIIFLARN